MAGLPGILGQIVGTATQPLLDTVYKVIDNFHASDEEKAAAKLAVVNAQQDFQLKTQELDTEWAGKEAEVIESEAKSQSWIARNWRPILMLVFTYIIFHTYVLAPLFSFKAVIIPPDMWELLKLGMGGYLIGRSAEKIAGTVMDAAPQIVQVLGQKDNK